MKYEKKSLKLAAKITAGAFSEQGELGSENGREAAAFLKTLYEAIVPLKGDSDQEQAAFKAAGRIAKPQRRLQSFSGGCMKNW